MAGCPSLMQLGFIVTSVRGDGNVKGIFGWNEMKCTAFFFVQLVERLPKLIALLIVLPVACQSLCIAATTILEIKFRPQRPCFCLQITDSLNSIDPPKLPLNHYQVLAQDPPPIVGALPFHLLSQKPRY